MNRQNLQSRLRHKANDWSASDLCCIVTPSTYRTVLVRGHDRFWQTKQETGPKNGGKSQAAAKIAGSAKWELIFNERIVEQVQWHQNPPLAVGISILVHTIRFRPIGWLSQPEPLKKGKIADDGDDRGHQLASACAHHWNLSVCNRADIGTTRFRVINRPDAQRARPFFPSRSGVGSGQVLLAVYSHVEGGEVRHRLTDLSICNTQGQPMHIYQGLAILKVLLSRSGWRAEKERGTEREIK